MFSFWKTPREALALERVPANFGGAPGQLLRILQNSSEDILEKLKHFIQTNPNRKELQNSFRAM